MGHLFAFLAGAGVATWYLRHHTTYHAPPPGAGPHHPPATAPAYASQAERNKEWEEHCARLRDMGAQAGSTLHTTDPLRLPSHSLPLVKEEAWSVHPASRYSRSGAEALSPDGMTKRGDTSILVGRYTKNGIYLSFTDTLRPALNAGVGRLRLVHLRGIVAGFDYPLLTFGHRPPHPTHPTHLTSRISCISRNRAAPGILLRESTSTFTAPPLPRSPENGGNKVHLTERSDLCDLWILKISTYTVVYRACQVMNIDEHRVAARKVIDLTEESTEKERANRSTKRRACTVGLRDPLLELSMGWDVSDKIAPGEGVGDEVARYYFLQLIADMGVFYHDPNPENLLFGAFRLSAVFRLKQSGKTRTLLTERCGNLPSLNSDEAYKTEVGGCGRTWAGRGGNPLNDARYA
ncbi:hypothetical protein CCMSSC00406_0008832 [Pleurotus cornucopiae]|uniref:Uncharacterized protein n=1 Tax=Pleurotus cornucopiae TaxID=5321 RepID=A0ACB7IK55_PLECO|nr:hypothetical protein CCMSSC00406_0008832 [Pleurotus cornucopiae]